MSQSALPLHQCNLYSTPSGQGPDKHMSSCALGRHPSDKTILDQTRTYCTRLPSKYLCQFCNATTSAKLVLQTPIFFRAPFLVSARKSSACLTNVMRTTSPLSALSNKRHLKFLQVLVRCQQFVQMYLEVTYVFLQKCLPPLT
jgi:hypothetical protein